MRTLILLCLVAAVTCPTGWASAQQEEQSQQVRELEEPAPEAVELELTNPAVQPEASEPIVEEPVEESVQEEDQGEDQGQEEEEEEEEEEDRELSLIHI